MATMMMMMMATTTSEHGHGEQTSNTSGTKLDTHSKAGTGEQDEASLNKVATLNVAAVAAAAARNESRREKTHLAKFVR